MNKPIITLMMAAVALTGSAQSKLNWSAGRIMDEYRRMHSTTTDTRNRVRPASVVAAASATDPTVMLLIVNEDATTEAFENIGCEVVDLRGEIAIVRATLDKVDALAALPCVVNISFGSSQSVKTNNARAITGVEAIHKGEVSDDINGGNFTPYTGKDVLLGIIDQGFDINHLNFLDENGQSRFESFWHMYSSTGAHNVYNTPEDIAGFRTDYYIDTHGTHTSGIAGGGYKGELSWYDGDTDEDMEDMPSPFYGMAPEATLLGVGGTLHDENIIMGLYVLDDYARKAGKPLVVNMSFGSNLGPHDGSSALCKAITEYGKNNLLCIAAGNEGDINMSVTKTFTDDDNEMKTILMFTTYDKTHAQFYSDDDTSFDMELAVVDFSGNILSRVPVNPELGQQTVMCTSYHGGENYYPTEDMEAGFYRGSYISAMPQIDSANGRFMVDLQYELVRNSGKYYYIALIVKGEAGHRVTGYTANVYHSFSSCNFKGFTDGTKDGSLSDLATSDNVISVAAYVNRNQIAAYDGTPRDYSHVFTIGDECYFSSFGTLANGETRPHVAAPGALLVSSMNRYYGISDIDADKGFIYNPGSDKYVAVQRANNSIYLWEQQSGTSMATPVVAGIMTLWAEADNSLTVERALDILKQTSIRDSHVTEDPYPARWGYGKIDAVAGLKKVMSTSGVINNVEPGTDDDSRIIITPLGSRNYEVFVNGEQGMTASLVSMSGARVLTAAAEGDTLTFDASGVTPGVYVLTVSGSDTTYSRKFIIR